MEVKLNTFLIGLNRILKSMKTNVLGGNGMKRQILQHSFFQKIYKNGKA